MTLRVYFGAALHIEFYYRHPRNYCRRAVYSIDEPAPTMRGVNRPVPKGYPGHPNDACPVDENVRALTTLERSLQIKRAVALYGEYLRATSYDRAEVPPRYGSHCS